MVAVCGAGDDAIVVLAVLSRLSLFELSRERESDVVEAGDLSLSRKPPRSSDEKLDSRAWGAPIDTVSVRASDVDRGCATVVELVDMLSRGASVEVLVDFFGEPLPSGILLLLVAVVKAEYEVDGRDGSLGSFVGEGAEAEEVLGPDESARGDPALSRSPPLSLSLGLSLSHCPRSLSLSRSLFRVS